MFTVGNVAWGDGMSVEMWPAMTGLSPTPTVDMYTYTLPNAVPFTSPSPATSKYTTP